MNRRVVYKVRIFRQRDHVREFCPCCDPAVAMVMKISLVSIALICIGFGVVANKKGMFKAKPERQTIQVDKQLDVPLKGFQTVVAPTEIPTDIPPINLQEKFDPKDYSGSGVEGGVATGMVPMGEVYAEALVDVRPDLLAGPPPIYPELLRQAGIQGRVLVQFVVDTMGKAEVSTIRIIQTPNPGFNDVVRTSVVRSQFRPGRVRGRAVRVLTELPFDFKIR